MRTQEAEPAGHPLTPLTVPLRSRRRQRALLVQKLQHVFPAAVLLGAGLQEFLGELPHGWGLALAITEIVVGLLMLAALARAAYGGRHLLKRRADAAHTPHHTHPAVEWENFIAAALVLAEGWEHRMHGGHHFPRPAILLAAVLMVTGLLHGRLMRAAERRRALCVNDEGLYVPGRKFQRKIEAKWADLASIEIGERWAVVTTRTGQNRRLDLVDLDRGDEVRHALEAARRAFQGVSNA
jgi:hypothetical protein